MEVGRGHFRAVQLHLFSKIRVKLQYFKNSFTPPSNYGVEGDSSVSVGTFMRGCLVEGFLLVYCLISTFF